ncbi:MAG: histidine kinase [Gammaproteobacteria bacterium]|nr:histidine kinase [Gammaproteobacteria bacterium]MDH3758357.1 histidine kinase [Gammaproteobacteria bacterium]MDH3848848.1 histidine kinase [Gammaproteobacteria bacterium]MDH3864546.1 histidine kinase [Gammaproteobacteria bacterium]MDH3906535.1 histidine kinase [Gammaproteobacteria bacterium]
MAVANSSSSSAESESQVYLPDFCATGTVFVVVLVAALVAIVLTLAGTTESGRFLFELSKTALFVLWLALLGCALMCVLRSRLEEAGKTRAFALGYVILLAMCLLLAEIAYQLTRIFAESVIIHDSHAGFLFRTFMVSAIVIALGMRYLYVSSEWRRSIVLEAQARISALQALIRPHFLFNSMNTIASLTRTDPRQAEEAVEDLSDLLRANLGSSKNRTSLKQELETAAIYQRIEKLRLGDRLKVRWDVADLPMRALIPSLTIQPLLENAIYHGIELLPDGGEVTVTGKRDGRDLVISMSNPVASGTERSKRGNKMAMGNIRQRFELAYGNRAAVEISDESDRFTVSLRFPLEEGEA